MTTLATHETIEGPYPGLRPFKREESLIFFGRDSQVDELAARLGGLRSRFLAVVGFSGCGKSSLVRAGLIPRLNSSLTIAPGKSWRVAMFRPGEAPLRNLVDALLGDEALRAAWAKSPDPAAAISAAISRGPLGLSAALAGMSIWRGENLLLVVDQFEEVFRFLKEGNRDVADAFVALLLATAASSLAPIYVVLTMRSDFLGDCDLFPGLPEQLNDGQFLTPRLTFAQSREAVEGPAGVFDATLEPELVEKILHDMTAVADPLPLMQHALMRLWLASGAAPGSVLTLDAYHRIGGVAGVLNQHVEEEFNKLDDKQKRICEVMFRRLSELGADQRDVRRPTPLDEVARVAGLPIESWDALRNVADHFRAPEVSVLNPTTPSKLEPGTVLDITHEALIRQWERLKGWVTQEAASAEQYFRLESAAARKDENNASFWVTPELDIALAWKHKEQPNAAWARRYGEDFDRAFRFLNGSASEAASEEAKRQETAQRMAGYEQEQRLAKERFALEVERREADRKLLVEAEARQKAEEERAEDAIAAKSRIERLYRFALILGFSALALAAVSIGSAIFAVTNLSDARTQTRIAHKAKLDASEHAAKAEFEALKARKQAGIANAQRLSFQSQSIFNSNPVFWASARR